MSNINRSYTMPPAQVKASKVGMGGYAKKGGNKKRPNKKKGKRGGY